MLEGNPDNQRLFLRQPGANPALMNLLADQTNDELINVASKPDWVTGTVYAAGAIVKPLTGNTGGYFYRTTAGGTSGSSEPSPWTQQPGAVCTDGVVADWVCMGNLPFHYPN